MTTAKGTLVRTRPLQGRALTYLIVHRGNAERGIALTPTFRFRGIN
jgi:hypothetical protein